MGTHCAAQIKMQGSKFIEISEEDITVFCGHH